MEHLGQVSPGGPPVMCVGGAEYEFDITTINHCLTEVFLAKLAIINQLRIPFSSNPPLNQL